MKRPRLILLGSGLAACTTGYDLRPLPPTPENLALAVRDKDVVKLRPGKITICLRDAYPVGPYTSTTTQGDGAYATRVVDRRREVTVTDPQLVGDKLCGVEEVHTNGLGDKASSQCLARSEISAVMIPTAHPAVEGSVLEKRVQACPGDPPA